jgi:menaquinone-9 beta-reductase
MAKGGRVVCSRQGTDVFVVGGGPAGLATAIAARQKGLRVIVADGAAPPIEKPCGEGLMLKTLASLRALGVEMNPADGRRFRGVCFVQDATHVFADFAQGQGVGLRRTVLHERLIAKAEDLGVRLLWKTPVSGIDPDGAYLSRGKIHARWIVGADGQGSRVRKWSGLGASKLSRKRPASRRHYCVKPWSSYMEIYWGSHTQAYVTPITHQEVCVVVTAECSEHASFDFAFRELPQLKEKLGGAELSSRERGAVTVMRSLNNVQGGNVALVGDASGGVDAITGDGLRLAFAQALALAEAISANDLRRYQHDHRELARRAMPLGKVMLWLANNERLRRRVIHALDRSPELFARLLATHIGQGTSGELLSTGAHLGWQLLAS